MASRRSLIPKAQVQPFVDSDSRLGILHAGGPAPGGNQVIYAASLRARDHGLPILAFKQGYQHLMTKSPEDVENNWAMLIGREEIRYLRDQVSLLTGSGRANPGKDIRTGADMSDPERTAPLDHVIEVLDALRIGALISVGGDDTMRSANLIQMHLDGLSAKGQVPKYFRGVVHVPKTIDKDTPGIDYTFGFMSAAEVIGDQVKALHDDAKATATESELVYHVAEIMGRSAGWLCAAASVYGQATYAIVPEEFEAWGGVTMARLANDCVDVILTRKRQGKNYGAITIAEGLGDLLPAVDVAKDEFGHTRLDELKIAVHLCEAIKRELARRVDIRIKLRSRTFGYEARQVRPNFFDVLLSQRLGVSAVDAILRGYFGHLVSVEGVLSAKFIPFSTLIDPETQKMHSWHMSKEEGLYRLMLSMQQQFDVDVDKK
jgi:6-phosphofructokinase